MPIDLAFSTEQQHVQEAARDYFARRCPPEVVRALEADERGFDPAMWQEMADMGWFGITVPEQYGGHGGTFLDAYPLHEELGAALVPGPVLDTASLAVDVLLAAGSEEQRAELLPAIVGGSCIITPALFEPEGTFGPSGVALTAVRRGDGLRLTGTKLLVPFAPHADLLLCTVRTSGDASAHGITLALVDPRAPGVIIERLSNVAGNALYAVTLDGVEVPASRVVGPLDGGWPALADAATRAAVLQTASIIGAARRVLAMTNQYAKDREQFGSPIGRYQAVQYLVTDILIDLHRTELLAKQAAYRIDAGKPYAREAAMAITFGKKAAAHLHRQAHEVHAGIAFMLEHDLTLYSRRSKYWENNLGDARYYEERVAEAMRI